MSEEISPVSSRQLSQIVLCSYPGQCTEVGQPSQRTLTAKNCWGQIKQITKDEQDVQKFKSKTAENWMGDFTAVEKGRLAAC
ncbi:hypothetical protein AOLI_G00125650 [Acnodon oligacanthus]